MKRGHYVTAIRGKRVAWLAGPYATAADALAAKPAVSAAALDVDPFIAFDLIGTAMREGVKLPLGKLNATIAIDVCDECA